MSKEVQNQKQANPFFKPAKGKWEKSSRKNAEKLRQNRTARVQRARDLFKSGVLKVRIAEQLGVTYPTVHRWLKDEPDPKKSLPEEPKDAYQKNLEETIEESVDERLSARDAEDAVIEGLASNQSSPADQYQAYVAANAIKILRDNLLNIRGPRTIREMSELDQLIRRNLGLNPTKGGGGGSLTIDISVLNNAKAANGGTKVVIEAEEVDE